MMNKLFFKANLIHLSNFTNKLAKSLTKGDCLVLYGDLGAGKTTFTSFLSKSLMVMERVKSPTFNIMNEYFSENGMRIIHIDAYRLTNSNDISIQEFLKDSILIIEWPDVIKDILPKDCIKISFEYLNQEEREITLEIIGEKNKELINNLKEE